MADDVYDYRWAANSTGRLRGHLTGADMVMPIYGRFIATLPPLVRRPETRSQMWRRKRGAFCLPTLPPNRRADYEVLIDGRVIPPEVRVTQLSLQRRCIGFDCDGTVRRPWHQPLLSRCATSRHLDGEMGCVSGPRCCDSTREARRQIHAYDGRCPHQVPSCRG